MSTHIIPSRLAGAALLLLGACGPEPLVLEAETDGGTWVVSTAEAPLSEGESTLRLHVEADGEPASGLVVTALASMGGMDHGGDATAAEEQGEGDYAVPLSFSMAGAWEIDGEVSDGSVTEGYTLTIEVE